MKVLVTGGTGVLGHHIVERLAPSHELVVLSRSEQPGAGDPGEPTIVRGDLTNGEGLDGALREVEVVIHAASGFAPRGQRRGIRAVDIAGTEHLVQAAADNGVAHLIYVSILGVDRIPTFYYSSKHRAEQIVAAGKTPWTIVRVAQFHELLDAFLRRLARPPVAFVPRGFRFQPIAAVDAAHALADVLEQAPRGGLLEVGGPAVLGAEEAAGAWLAARGSHKRVGALPVPGRVGRAFRAGYNLSPTGTREGISFATWVSESFARSEPGYY